MFFDQKFGYVDLLMRVQAINCVVLFIYMININKLYSISKGKAMSIPIIFTALLNLILNFIFLETYGIIGSMFLHHYFAIVC